MPYLVITSAISGVILAKV